MICNNCKIFEICKIREFVFNNYNIVNITIDNCKYYENRTIRLNEEKNNSPIKPLINKNYNEIASKLKKINNNKTMKIENESEIEIEVEDEKKEKQIIELINCPNCNISTSKDSLIKCKICGKEICNNCKNDTICGSLCNKCYEEKFSKGDD